MAPIAENGLVEMDDTCVTLASGDRHGLETTGDDSVKRAHRRQN